MEPTFLAVAQGLIQKSHVNIGEYIRASNGELVSVLS